MITSTLTVKANPLENSLLQKASEVRSYPHLVEFTRSLKSLKPEEVREFVELGLESKKIECRITAAFALGQISSSPEYLRLWSVGIKDSDQRVRETIALSTPFDTVTRANFKTACALDASEVLRAAYTLRTTSLDDLKHAASDSSALVRILVCRRLAVLFKDFKAIEQDEAKRIVESLAIDHRSTVRAGALLAAQVVGSSSLSTLKGLIVDSRAIVHCEDLFAADPQSREDEAVKAGWRELDMKRFEFPTNALLFQLQITNAQHPGPQVDGHQHVLIPIGERLTVAILAADFAMNNYGASGRNVVESALARAPANSTLKRHLTIASEVPQRK